MKKSDWGCSDFFPIGRLVIGRVVNKGLNQDCNS
jgi:hypothetical protein